MLANRGKPARADRRGLQPGGDIDRVFGEPVVTEAALEPVGRRGYRDQSGLGVGWHLPADRPVAVEAKFASGRGKARQHHPVGEAEGKETARVVADPRIKILEIFGQNRSLDHAGKMAILAWTPPADAEERRALIGRT